MGPARGLLVGFALEVARVLVLKSCQSCLRDGIFLMVVVEVNHGGVETAQAVSSHTCGLFLSLAAS